MNEIDILQAIVGQTRGDARGNEKLSVIPTIKRFAERRFHFDRVTGRARTRGGARDGNAIAKRTTHLSLSLRMLRSPDAADCDRMLCRQKTICLQVNKEQVHAASLHAG